jgi:hypothetical protein
MRDPLENIVIGNFLYGLGLSMGQRAGANAPVGCVNLLQQTPLDRSLGDVFIRFTGAVRLFEFKRSTASKLKELRKLTVLQAAIRNRPDLRALSRQIHWYVETKKDHPDFSISARPYLDMVDRKMPVLDLAGTIRDVVDQALAAQPEDNARLVDEYLKAVALFAGERTGSSSGVLVAMDGKGGIQWVAVDDIRDLNATPMQLFERSRFERQKSLELERERSLPRQRSLSRSGPSLDHSR